MWSRFERIRYASQLIDQKLTILRGDELKHCIFDPKSNGYRYRLMGDLHRARLLFRKLHYNRCILIVGTAAQPLQPLHLHTIWCDLIGWLSECDVLCLHNTSNDIVRYPALSLILRIDSRLNIVYD